MLGCLSRQGSAGIDDLPYHFNDFVLDSNRRELRRGADQIPVEPQVFDLLEFLIRARDRVVNRDELLDAVWRGRIVSDATLSSRLNAARTAIGDSGEAQRLIRTLPRKGIRFVGEVRETRNLPSAAGVPDPAHPADQEMPSIAVLPFTTSWAELLHRYLIFLRRPNLCDKSLDLMVQGLRLLGQFGGRTQDVG